MKRRTRAECLPIDNGDGTASVPLHDGAFAIIDSVDIGRASFLSWQHRVEPHGNHYAMAGFFNSTGKFSMIRMHRLLLCFPFYQIDHIDRNGLNNSRSNLRICNNHNNQWNCKKVKPSKYSKFKGVSKHRKTGLWTAQLMKNRKHVHAKYFKTEVEAARSYDEAAIIHFGEFAATNVTLGLLPPLSRKLEAAS